MTKGKLLDTPQIMHMYEAFLIVKSVAPAYPHQLTFLNTPYSQH